MKELNVSKKQFILFIVTMFVVAGSMAYFFNPQDNTKTGQTADIAYLMVTGVITFYLCRVGLVTIAIGVAYCASILFCFYYFFISPFEAPVVLLSYLLPAILWQKKKLGVWGLSFFGVLLILLSWKIFGRPAVPVLLFPVFHLVAMRISTRVFSRYSKETVNINAFLSQRQREKRYQNLGLTDDWWFKIKPEIDVMPKKIMEFWGELLDINQRRHQGTDSVLDRNLLKLQNAEMMAKALTAIRRRDPDFNTSEFIKRIDKVFWKIQNAWYSQHLGQIQHIVSDALFEQFKRQIDEQKAAGITFQYNNMSIYNTRIAQVNTDKNYDSIHVFIRASSADALFDLETGEELAKNEERRKFCEYWTFVRRPSAKTLKKPGLLEGNCPNCGAPVEIGQATVCKICESFIRSGSYDWVLAKITQACEWEYYESSLLKGWNEMVQQDPNFNVQQIEDRAAVIFWMQRLAERKKDSRPLRRFATEALCSKYFTRTGGSALPPNGFIENVNLGSVKLQGFKISKYWDRIFVLVIWSGVPVFLDQDGIPVSNKGMNQVRRDVLVLMRRHGVKTNLNTTLTSAHCPNCGAPLDSTYSLECSYCCTILNEGSKGWILERITSEFDSEYMMILKSKAAAKEQLSENENPEIRSARDVITVAAQLLIADGQTATEELDLLEKVASSHGMAQEEINSIIYSLQNGKIYIPAPANSRESWNLLQSAAKMALCDNDLSEAEEKSLYNLAQHIGYSKADVKRAIKMEVKRRYAAGEDIDPNLLM
ncbi:MAG: transporter [Candidatus Rifleibacteriota bacterium]